VLLVNIGLQLLRTNYFLLIVIKYFNGFVVTASPFHLKSIARFCISTEVVCMYMYVCIVRAGVQPTLDPYAEAFL